MKNNNSKEKNDKLIAFYCRTLHQEPDENFEHLAVQFKELKEYGRKHFKGKRYSWYTDNHPNFFDRRGLSRLMKDVRDGKISTIITIDSTRSSQEYLAFKKQKETLKEKGVSIIVLSTPETTFIESVLESLTNDTIDPVVNFPGSEISSK